MHDGRRLTWSTLSDEDNVANLDLHRLVRWQPGDLLRTAYEVGPPICDAVNDSYRDVPIGAISYRHSAGVRCPFRIVGGSRRVQRIFLSLPEDRFLSGQGVHKIDVPVIVGRVAVAAVYPGEQQPGVCLSRGDKRSCPLDRGSQLSTADPGSGGAYQNDTPAFLHAVTRLARRS
jgi:hypothetical protein